MVTKIEWCQESWNPVTGCTKISEACEHCYAERMAKRLRGRFGYPADNPFKVTWQGNRIIPSKGYRVLDEPLHWRKPMMIFVVSMGDLFHDDVDLGWYSSIFNVFSKCPQHIFMLLTKRPEKMRKVFELYLNPIFQNVWLGVTAENQKRYDERWPILAQIPAAIRFISIEPMLSHINMHLGTSLEDVIWRRMHGVSTYDNRNLPDWIICGGESGPGARPMRPDWPILIRDQCQDAGVPFFFKQWGEWVEYDQIPKNDQPTGKELNEKLMYHWGPYTPQVYKVGKKKAGRLLDGREWNEYPKI